MMNRTISHKPTNFDEMIEGINTVYLLISSKMASQTLIGALVGSLTTFITSYVWDSAEAVYTLIFLMVFNWGISAYLSIKCSMILKFQKEILKPKQRIALTKKKFSMLKFVGIMGAIIVAFCLLGVSWNISKANPLFYFLPGFVYGGFATGYLISLGKNLTDAGFFSQTFLDILKEKLKIKNNQE